MRCYYPLTAYRAIKSENGKRGVSFKLRQGYHDLPVKVPCGQCVGCRLERSRQWALRCMHEASLYEDNIFLTLTYDDTHIPPDGGLNKRHWQDFIRAVRKRYMPQRLKELEEGKRDDARIRYFHAGEYGDYTGRPHYHGCLFNFRFPDQRHFTTRKGFPVYVSEELRELWGKGLSEIGSVTFESAAYIARYILKKVTGNELAKALRYGTFDATTGEIGQVQSEYATMSRRPGIGYNWLEQYGEDVYKDDSVVVRRALQKPPRYYDLLWEQQHPDHMEEVRQSRKDKRDKKEETEARLQAHRQVTEARIKLKTRGLEQ